MSNHIIKKTISLPENCTYQIKEKGVLLKFNQGVDLNLVWIHLIVEIENNQLVLSYLKKWESLASPIVTTWTNLIKKYAQNPLYSYVVKPLSKHFPIILGIQGKTITVFNYLGLKKTFYVHLHNVQTLELKNKEIHLTSANDIITGSDLNMLKAIRYKTHHRKLDRRIFTDGFLIQKTCSI